jgi:putative copper resistance protein D
VNPDANVGAFSPLREALGFTPPPAPSLANLGWAQWRPDVFWLLIALLGALAYIAGTRRLTQRGDEWSRARTFSWLAGLAVLTYATSGPLGVYGHIFFSAHMVQHLLLVMVCPILLMCGAPTTLALRALPANRENHGPREWLLALLQSKYLAVIAHPLFAFINFIAGFFALYFSGLFEMLMQSHTGHLFMQLLFLTSGYLFFWAIIGIDPAPRKLPNPAKVGLVILAAPFHALFSVIIMQSTTVFAGNYFEQFRSAYAVNSLHDQYLGASFGWAFGEVPMVIVIAIAVRQWVRADARTAARFDRLDDERRARAQPASEDEKG